MQLLVVYIASIVAVAISADVVSGIVDSSAVTTTDVTAIEVAVTTDGNDDAITVIGVTVVRLIILKVLLFFSGCRRSYNMNRDGHGIVLTLQVRCQRIRSLLFFDDIPFEQFFFKENDFLNCVIDIFVDINTH